MKRDKARLDYLRRHREFVKAHPLARSLTSAECAFALSLAQGHHDVKLYRSGGEIILSRQAMHSPPGVRESFIVHGKGKGRIDEDARLEETVMREAGNSKDLLAVLDEIHRMDWAIRDEVTALMEKGEQDAGFELQRHRDTLGELEMRIKQRCSYRPPRNTLKGETRRWQSNKCP